MDMLVNDRLDVALANNAVGRAMVRKYPDLKIKAAERSTDMDTFFMALSKKSTPTGLMPEINRVIHELQKEGFIEGLVKGRQSLRPTPSFFLVTRLGNTAYPSCRVNQPATVCRRLKRSPVGIRDVLLADDAESCRQSRVANKFGRLYGWMAVCCLVCPAHARVCHLLRQVI